jgi:hypothetical protein
VQPGLPARLVERGEPLGRAVRQFDELLDDYGQAPLQHALEDATRRGVFHVPALRHALERQGTIASAGKTELRAGLREVVVRPHDLGTYDALHATEDTDVENA